MAYDYGIQRKALFTESGVETLTAVRDTVKKLTRAAGAVRAQEAMMTASGDTWTALAALDYMVERGELREITDPQRVCGQHRVFVAIEGGA